MPRGVRTLERVLRGLLSGDLQGFHDMSPIWTLANMMDFGSALTLYRRASAKIRNEVVSEAGVTARVLESWLVAINTIRNYCVPCASVEPRVRYQVQDPTRRCLARVRADEERPALRASGLAPREGSAAHGVPRGLGSAPDVGAVGGSEGGASQEG